MTHRRLPPEQQQLLRRRQLILINLHSVGTVDVLRCLSIGTCTLTRGSGKSFLTLCVASMDDARFEKHESDRRDAAPRWFDGAKAPSVGSFEATMKNIPN